MKKPTRQGIVAGVGGAGCGAIAGSASGWLAAVLGGLLSGAFAFWIVAISDFDENGRLT